MKKTLIFLPIVATLLGGCVGTKHYDADKYFTRVVWKGSSDFKILQLNDIHLSQSDKYEEHFALIKRTIKASEPNLIVLNGDIFTYADKQLVNRIFSFIDSFGIYWTYTFGNHDDQGYYSDTFIPKLLASGKYVNVRFINLPDDDVTGRSNFVINLTDFDSKKVLYQVYVLDSHSYNFNTMGYDYLKQDQIDWYERMVKYSTKTLGGGTVIPSSMYMHIGFPEIIEAWDQTKPAEKQENLLIGDMEEWGGSPKKDPGFFKKMQELKSTKSVHVAHNHASDSIMFYGDPKVYFCFGVHSTDRIYNDENCVKLGGQVIRINKTTKEISFRNYYASYKNNDVKYLPEISTKFPEGWAK